MMEREKQEAMISPGQELISKKRCPVWLNPELTHTIDNIAREYGVKWRTRVIRRLIEEHETLKKTASGLPVATYGAIMDDPIGPPVVICGLPGAGKTFTMRAALEEAIRRGIPFFLIDTVCEHGWVRKNLNYTMASSLPFLREHFGPCRFTPIQEGGESLYEVRKVIEALQHRQSTGALKEIIFAVEEAHRFRGIKAFNDFVIEGRKWTKKIILCSTIAEYFPMCRPLSPLPRQVP